MSPRLEGTSVTLEQVIVNAIDAALLELHTGLPAKVVLFDPATQSCDVQPLLQRVYADADAGLDVPIDLPQIQNVPIEYPAGGGFAITWPLEAGDIVFLAFCERSLDSWLEAAPGLSIDPLESRKHHLSDAVARAGLRQRRAPLPGLTTPTLKIGREDGTTILEITADGQLLLSAGGAATQPVPLGQALSDYLTTKLSVATAFGPSGPALVPLLPGVELSLLVKVK